MTMYSGVTTGNRSGHFEPSDGFYSSIGGRPEAWPSRAAPVRPDQIFAFGYAAFFGSAADFVVHQQKTDASGAAVICKVDTYRGEGGYFGAAKPTVTVARLDRAVAQAMVKTAHELCLRSRATRGNIAVTLSVARSPPPPRHAATRGTGR